MGLTQSSASAGGPEMGENDEDNPADVSAYMSVASTSPCTPGVGNLCSRFAFLSLCSPPNPMLTDGGNCAQPVKPFRMTVNADGDFDHAVKISTTTTTTTTTTAATTTTADNAQEETPRQEAVKLEENKSLSDVCSSEGYHTGLENATSSPSASNPQSGEGSIASSSSSSPPPINRPTIIVVVDDKKERNKVEDVQRPDDGPIEKSHSVEHYERLVSELRQRLDASATAAEHELQQSGEQLSEVTMDLLRAAVGGARQLLRKKIASIEQLIVHCKNGVNSEGRCVKLDDLVGYWETVQPTVNDVLQLFTDAEKSREAVLNDSADNNANNEKVSTVRVTPKTDKALLERVRQREIMAAERRKKQMEAAKASAALRQAQQKKEEEKKSSAAIQDDSIF